VDDCLQIRLIRTYKDHRAALAEIAKLWGESRGTPEGDKLDVLVTLVETYAGANTSDRPTSLRDTDAN
jgi:hypothetical protein